MWRPTQKEIEKTNISSLMREIGCDTYAQFYDWSVRRRGDFWEKMIAVLGVQFMKPYRAILKGDAENPSWCDGAKLNIAASCFQSAPESTAILFQEPGGSLQKMSYGELDQLSNRVAKGLVEAGFRKGDAIAIDM